MALKIEMPDSTKAEKSITIEKISNGWLVTESTYNYNSMKHIPPKKTYYEKKPEFCK